MWPLLMATGIAPPAIRGAHDDDKMPALAGVGFTDIGTGHPGTDSAQFSSETIQGDWAPDFYARLARHVRRASAAVPGCVCGRCGAPCLVAFSGKRQYVELMNASLVAGAPAAATAGTADAAAAAAGAAAAAVDIVGSPGKQRRQQKQQPAAAAAPRRAKVATVPLGRQPALPPGWPLPPWTEVWVLTSTSGASALTNEARAAPYEALAARLREIPWPRNAAARCADGGGGGQESGGGGGGP